ncbi:Tetratricopeptide repeat protein 25 [Entophlyctis luteolus]|nr:Tetratricopeptide repeat protein 25 [Entophlyctis luteolus]
MPDDGDSESHENLVAKFQCLSAEGDLLAQRRAFPLAINVFSQALDIRPSDKHCLVSRSKCYIRVGTPALALDDANACLQEDPLFFKGIFQKAEALYAMGDFELALMFYHRGNRLRPELDEFRIGIQKSREAIENSIGKNDKPKDFKIEISSKLRKNLAALFNTSGASAAATQPISGKGNVAAPSTPGAAVLSTTAPAGTAPNSGLAASSSPFNAFEGLNSVVENKLLGELYDDKVYLQGLINDRDFINHPDDRIVELVSDGLRYLRTRLEFWRQQNPLYARPKAHKIQPRIEVHTRKGSGDPVSPPVATASAAAAKKKRKEKEQQQQRVVPLPPINA